MGRRVPLPGGAPTLSALKLTGLAPMAARRHRSRRSKLARKRAAALCGALAHGAGGTRQAGMNVQRKEHAGAEQPGESTVWKLEAPWFASATRGGGVCTVGIGILDWYREPPAFLAASTVFGST